MKIINTNPWRWGPLWGTAAGGRRDQQSSATLYHELCVGLEGPTWRLSLPHRQNNWRRLEKPRCGVGVKSPLPLRRSPAASRCPLDTVVASLVPVLLQALESWGLGCNFWVSHYSTTALAICCDRGTALHVLRYTLSTDSMLVKQVFQLFKAQHTQKRSKTCEIQSMSNWTLGKIRKNFVNYFKHLQLTETAPSDQQKNSAFWNIVLTAPLPSLYLNLRLPNAVSDVLNFCLL